MSLRGIKIPVPGWQGRRGQEWGGALVYCTQVPPPLTILECLIWGDRSQVTTLCSVSILSLAFDWLVFPPSIWIAYESRGILIFHFLYFSSPLCTWGSLPSLLSHFSAQKDAELTLGLWLLWVSPLYAPNSRTGLANSGKEVESDCKRAPGSENCLGLLVFALCSKSLPYSWIQLFSQ